ncbi:methionyl-tRNA formyltransferase [Candidatus Saccharibacteria bacterium]|nr:methionyl-tRNA formyltransferase [Candidatus Saccharibacteria bacterium]
MASEVIFFGNGPLADYALEVIKRDCEVIFHARSRGDLEEVCRIKKEMPGAHGILASFGVMIPEKVLELFEPEGILNIHPSLLPLYRGASPIESAILNGDTEFSVSVMKLVKAMDAGPIYYQTTLSDLPLCKDDIYKALAETGADWICQNLMNLSEPVLQDDSKTTYCGKLDKSMSLLTPETDTAEVTFRKIVAYQGYPKPKYAFYGINCIILEAHILKPGETALLSIPCADGGVVVIDRLQPEGKKPMDAKSFINGYKK